MAIPKTATEVDHIVPLSDGGPDVDENLQALSAECHKAKSKDEAEARSAAKYSVPAAADDALEFLRGVMNDLEQDARLRVRAAISLAQYQHTKRADGGKKEELEQAAAKAATGRFGASEPPRLVRDNTKAG